MDRSDIKNEISMCKLKNVQMESGISPPAGMAIPAQLNVEDRNGVWHCFRHGGSTTEREPCELQVWEDVKLQKLAVMMKQTELPRPLRLCEATHIHVRGSDTNRPRLAKLRRFFELVQQQL